MVVGNVMAQQRAINVFSCVCVELCSGTISYYSMMSELVCVAPHPCHCQRVLQHKSSNRPPKSHLLMQVSPPTMLLHHHGEVRPKANMC